MHLTQIRSTAVEKVLYKPSPDPQIRRITWQFLGSPLLPHMWYARTLYHNSYLFILSPLANKGFRTCSTSVTSHNSVQSKSPSFAGTQPYPSRIRSPAYPPLTSNGSRSTSVPHPNTTIPAPSCNGDDVLQSSPFDGLKEMHIDCTRYLP
jgi:hypothetical protein